MQMIADLKVGNEYYGLFLLLGVLLASLLVTPNSLPAILVSLERQNFGFLTTTPQDLKAYLLLKFRFILIIQEVASLVVLLFIAIFGKFTIIGSILFVLGGALYTIPATSHYLLKDYKKPFFEWSDYIQLINRGQSNAMMLLIMFVKLIVTIIAVVIKAVSVELLGAFWPNLIMSIIASMGILAFGGWQILKWREI